MKVTWTKEQQKVIDLRNRNILVSAAAGSGKTAVLVERIITMLTEDESPVDVDRLLIVTFTEAAAAEMKERIRNAIEKKLEEYPGNEHLKQQATLIHNAQITTIHSFCLSVIRDHFHAIDIDPGFRIGEEGELKLLRHDVLEDMLEDRYQRNEQRFLDFAAAYGGGRSDKKVEELVLKIYEYSRSYPDSEGWLSSCLEAYKADSLLELEKSGYILLVMDNVRRYLDDAGRLLNKGLDICNAPDGPAVYEAALRSDLRIIEELRETRSFTELGEKMNSVKWMRLAANRDKAVSEEKAAKVKAIREEVKGLVKDLAGQYFYQDAPGILEDLQICRPAMEELASLVREFAERFEEKKRSKNMIDFSDMEQYALRILTDKSDEGFVPSVIAREYQQQFLEIMIDEYQDSNLIQEAILTSISTVSEGRYNIFMVGDVKQSIYRFRLSRPELFMEKFNTYDTDDSKTQRIDLHKNFRSRREVLEGVNYIFRQIMTRELGGIVYDDQAALYVGADYKDGENMETEVLVIDSNVDAWEDEAQAVRGITERELEARAIAGRIRELIHHHQVTDKKTGEFRLARYSDIVILTRSIKGFADVFTEVLSKEGIPTYAGTREGYFATQEIGVILDYLRVLDNQRQDIPLAAVLASPIGAMTEEELAIIRSSYKERPFFQAVSDYLAGGEDESIRGKLGRCLGQMEAFRKVVPYTPMHELLHMVLEKTGYGDYACAMPGGEQRKANLEMLAEKARVFESTSYKGLFHFIRYIEQLQKYDVDYGEASIEDEQSDTVRIMTIHKSKGLEFPIVFVAGMGKRFNMQDARSSVVLHSKMGVGLDAIHIANRTKSPSLVKKIIQKEEALDSLGEELRVLYVALTRAKEKLIITGTIPNLEKKMPLYEMGITFGRLSKASTYWDWILPAVSSVPPEVPIAVKRIAFDDIVKEEVIEETAGRMTRAMLEAWNTSQVYDPAMHEAIKEQFGYQYPYAGSGMQKLKFTVSELKKRIYLKDSLGEELDETGELLYEEPEVVPLIPRFLKEEEELTGASRGTAYHRLMELLDLAQDYGEAELADAVSAYVEEGKMDADMAACIRHGDILGFLNGGAGRRMKAAARAGTLWREQPFVLGVDAREMYPEEQEGELILVQGIIDAYFEESDGLVVLDYKTDQIYTPEGLIERYHSQLDYYAKALEQLTHKKVKEKIIYSFTIKKEIRLP
ncbi:helicase-exonuclease AddAB subunit AddA [[Clostridium] scindens]|uniref:helicase-exonuclease AddAB subunit AddA n=1 Tax=Clostridium scindens (strain JCM 10418 / VPI 12708) TaxID=29347 RepID=UPI001E4A7BC8|nr:helicase-exonuclease AddAB subunit AddA [[Clostridium] scindens]BCZ29679.1 ATP-dependent helicase/nuclease subunit A [[Clostridium] scindens]